MKTDVDRYKDGLIWVKRGDVKLEIIPEMLHGNVEEVASTIRFEFLGRGVSDIPDSEMDQIAWRVMQTLE